ncbi:zinc finger A20 and AN1 domain-containing stress-associated protein 7 [Hevea brasiliensis]|uniref:zinc finger A20 and AN1 domain-containing stress-associated protein 7 n=1 Tax=Hevea brasiliensis TaxID=3981 RepID=UPI0025DA1EEE|nr:zinc finger A20 and AN1 domain-containing stress-associated protein 7 [Hevea brasiliensis]
MESQQNKEPPLCANGCGFYGTIHNRNLCSKCYEEYQQQEENASSFLHEKVKCSRLLKRHQCSMLLVCNKSSTSSIALLSLAAETIVDSSDEPASKSPKNRCTSCNKRLGRLIGC